MKNNVEAECVSFVDAFKLCVDTRRAEIEARKRQELAN